MSGRLLAALMGLAVAAGGGAPAWSQPEAPSLREQSHSADLPPPRGMDELVSLDLRSTEATDALKYLATKGGLNIAISKNVTGRVNLFLTDVPIRDVFDLILRSNELAFDKQGEVYNIMTEAEYRALYGHKFADLRAVRTFRLQYAIPQQAFNLLDTLKSEVGRLLVDEDSGTVLIMETPEKLKEMEGALATLEQGGTTRVFDLRYAKAKDVEERLKDQIELNKLGFVKADERSNQVIVKTLSNRMHDIEALVAALDRKTREVLIDSRIVKVSVTKNLDSGLDWSSIFSNLKFHGIDTVGDFRNSTTGTAPTETVSVTKLKIPNLNLGTRLSRNKQGTDLQLGKMVFGTVARDGYELFRFLETLGETKIISNPRIMVTERQEARIHLGTREAYVTTTTTAGQTTTTTAEEVQFIDVGIQLLVTPLTISDDGYISMKLKPEVSSVVRTLTTPSKNQIPIVDTSTAETNVVVRDGTTVIIGGLRKREQKKDNDQVPGWGRLPIIGNAFKQKNEDSETTELVVFITPHIVTGDSLVTGQEERFGGGIKTYRSYSPLSDAEPPAEGASATEEARP